MRSTREQWAKRVRRWVDSGLTAPEFAAEMGLNPRTLRYWKWRLGKEGREATSSSRRARRSRSKRQPKALPAPTRASFVEVTPAASTLARASRLSTDRIELVVDDHLVVRVPDGFDSETLRRVLAVAIDGGER